jgi:hypothetical protein
MKRGVPMCGAPLSLSLPASAVREALTAAVKGLGHLFVPIAVKRTGTQMEKVCLEPPSEGARRVLIRIEGEDA